MAVYRETKNNKGETRYWRQVSLGFNADGSRKRVRITADSKRELDLKESQLFIDDQADKMDEALVLFGDLLDLWLASKNGRNAKPTSVAIRKYAADHARSVLGDMQARKIRRADVHRLLDANSHLAKSSQKKILNAVRGALDLGVDREMIANNVAARMSVPESATSKDVEALTPEQVKALRQAVAGTQYEAFVAVLLMGLRSGEFRALTWADVDLSGTDPRLRVARQAAKDSNGKQAVTKTTKTQSAYRVLPLEKPVRDALKEHKVRQDVHKAKKGKLWNENNLIFPTTIGTIMGTKTFATWITRAGEIAWIDDLHPHMLRHTCASLLFDQGHDIATIADYMGHASPAVTMSTYRHRFSSKVSLSKPFLSEVYDDDEKAS